MDRTSGYKYIYLFIPTTRKKSDFFFFSKHISESGLMVIDHSYPVINLRKYINHLMALFLIEWCETLICYLNQIHRFKLLLKCVLFLWRNTERVCSAKVVLPHTSTSTSSRFCFQWGTRQFVCWWAVIVPVCIRDQKMHPARCTMTQSNQIINKIEP